MHINIDICESVIFPYPASASRYLTRKADQPQCVQIVVLLCVLFLCNIVYHPKLIYSCVHVCVCVCIYPWACCGQISFKDSCHVRSLLPTRRKKDICATNPCAIVNPLSKPERVRRKSPTIQPSRPCSESILPSHHIAVYYLGGDGCVLLINRTKVCF